MSEDLSRVIAVVNGKGGVGKTTITANVGGMLAASGYRILIVDMDPQGNLAEDLGYTGGSVDDDGAGLAQALSFGGAITPAVGVRPDLDVLVGGQQLDTAAAVLTMKAQKSATAAKRALVDVLAPIVGEYDLVLIDCPPGQETLQHAAIAAARWALIPVRSDASSRKGLREVARRLEQVLDVNPDLDLLGVVLFGVHRSSSRVAENARAAIAQDLGNDGFVLPVIRYAEAAAQESRDRGLLAMELEQAVSAQPRWYERLRGASAAPDAPRAVAVGVAADYQDLAQEIIHRISTAEAAEPEPAGAAR